MNISSEKKILDEFLVFSFRDSGIHLILLVNVNVLNPGDYVSRKNK